MDMKFEWEDNWKTKTKQKSVLEFITKENYHNLIEDFISEGAFLEE